MDILADGSSVDMGELALGQNQLRVAFMPWNLLQLIEDSILVPSGFVQRKSIYHYPHSGTTCVSRDTKLGPEGTSLRHPHVVNRHWGKLDEQVCLRRCRS